MCGGVYYTHNGKDVRVYFPNPAALLPVRKKDGNNELIAWGRRQQQAGQLPLGGWARQESIHKGMWDRYFPKPVKIPVIAFMEKDIEGKSHWFDLVKDQSIQGLLARDDNFLRVYVVTVVPELEDAVHPRWPKILMVNRPTQWD